MENVLPDRKVAVVYLSWLPYGLQHLQDFMASYRRFDAGCPHSLFILFNGLAHTEEPLPFFQAVREQLPAAVIHEIQDGQDIDAYFEIAGRLTEEYIVFFNTFTQFLSPQWLLNYVNAFDENTGLVGATGSYQSLYSTVYQTLKWSWDKEKTFGDNFDKYKMLVKAFVYWRWLVKPYPNPHVRTTGFMVRRQDFLSLKKRRLRKKFDAYLFENGRASMTNQLLKKGYSVALVGKDGRRYSIPEWKQSEIFWINEQPNLMVSDNQTEKYRQADTSYRDYLTYIAWGKK